MMSGGAAISWGSKLQDVVALSSTEAEYMALTHSAQEALYLQQLQVELGINHEGLGVLLLCDNQSSMKIAQNPVFHKAKQAHCYSVSLHPGEGEEWRDGTSVCEDQGNGGRPTYQKCWFASFGGREEFDGNA